MKKGFWDNKTVLVTGGFGFIGSHFVEELLAAGASVICLYRTYQDNFLTKIDVPNSRLRLVQVDLLDYPELQAMCKYVAPRIDVIINCAALDGNTEFKIKNAARILDTNLRITSNILNCAHDNDIKDIVLLSSAEIYSPNAKSPIKEEDDYKKQLGYTENGYVLSKTIAEVMAELHRKQFGMNIYLPRLTNVYGPRDNFNAETNRVIPSMIKKIAAGEDVEIWGDGSQTRQFIHVKDSVRAVMQMVEKQTHGALNIAPKESVSILELANTLSNILTQKSSIHLNFTKPIGVKARRLNTNQLYALIDFLPRSLHEGLEDTVNWFNQLNRVVVINDKGVEHT